MSGLFNIPEDVIWEMSQDDCSDRNAEAFGASDWERGFPSVRDIVNVQRLAGKRESVSASNRPQPRKCPKCGFGPLMYVDDDHLYYTSGKLAGKLHGCA
jgi:hypothetical protein